MAVLGENESILSLLLDNGGDVNRVDSFGRTLVFQAIKSADSHILMCILEHEPNKDVLFNGDTPMHMAVRENKITDAELLISHGYSTEAPNRDGVTPIQLAQRLRYTQILAVLDNPVMKQKLTMMPKRKYVPRIVEPIKDEEPAPTPPQPVPEPQPKPAAQETVPPIPEPPIVPKEQEPDPIPSVATWGSQTAADYSRSEPLVSPPQIQRSFEAPPMGYSQYVMVSFDEYALMQRRLTILEQLASRLIAGQRKNCQGCKRRPGCNKCPVCQNVFCMQDWAAHVARGCH